MATVASPPRAADQAVLLHGISWETYESLLADHLDRSVPRFTYDRGLLEIVSPTTVHERDNRTLAMLVEVVAEERGIDTLDVGSMTFKREDLQRGFEPDSCFYIRNEVRVRGRIQIDPAIDPPPDLIIEIDVASPSLNKLPIYAQLGVPEVWRAKEGRVTILTLRADAYVESVTSAALPPLTAEALTRFLRESRASGRTAWLRTVREWMREQGTSQGGVR